MTERRINRGLTLLLALCLAIPLAIAFADEDDAAEMTAYWRIVGNTMADDTLTQVMNGDAVPLAALKTVTPEDLLDFAAINKLPVSMARHAYYTAMADVLSRELTDGENGEAWQRLALFLKMKNNPRDDAANRERRLLRQSLTETDIKGYAADTGLPAGFLAWVMLDDEWYEPDWEDGDDWREGRRDWQLEDWVDASDLRERYGKDVVVSEEDVERVLRQNGHRFDD